ncbi:MAG: hypothetical protein C4341_03390 [Armatimonadota bacterium]
MRFALLLAALLGLVAAASAQPEVATLDRLEQILRRQEHLRLSGTRVVYLRVNGVMRTVTELVIRDGMRSRTEFPNDPIRKGMIILEDGRHRLEYIPQLNELRRGPSNRDQTLQQLRRMIQAARNGQIRFRHFDGGSVADRPTVAFEVSDAAGNVARRLWFDGATGLLLKSQLLGRGGALMGGFEFRRVTYNVEIEPRQFRFERKGVRVVDEVAGVDVLWALRPTWLPDGFEPTGEGMRSVAGRRVAFLHFSDGTHHITIFQSPEARLGEEPPPHSDVRLVSRRVGRVWAAAAGNVSDEVLRRILNSLAGGEGSDATL